MARELITKNVEGTNYQIGALNPFKSLAIFTKLTKLLAPSASKLMEFAKSDGKSGFNSELFGEVIKVIAEQLDEKDVQEIAQELLKNVLIEGRALQPLVEFAGRVPHMLAVLAAVIEVEFGGFLQCKRLPHARTTPWGGDVIGA